MKQSTKRVMSSLVALVIFIGALVVFFEFLIPAFSDAQLARGESLSKQAFLENEKKIVNQFNTTIASYKGQGALQDAVSAALPPTPDIAGALAAMNFLADRSNLKIQALSLSVPPAAPPAVGAATSTIGLVRPVGSITFQVKFLGTYGDFKNFIRSLETNVRIMDAKTVAVQQAVKPTIDQYLFDLTVVTYYQS